MFSYPLFERLKSATPEFEALTAFQAAGARASVRRDDESVPRPLRSEYVTGNYFATLGVNAFTGRVFTASDDTPAAPPTVVLSYHAWKRIEFQSHFVRGLLLVTNTPAGTLEPQVKRALADTDPNLTVTSVRSLRQQIERSFDQQRAVASLAGLFGVVALALAAIGLYGVTAYSVARRRNEIGIRMALGADRGQVVGLVLRGAFRRVVIGLVLGSPLAVGAGYLLSAQLYGLQFWDPAALSLAAVALGIAAFVASIVPAARAATIAPMKALRIE